MEDKLKKFGNQYIAFQNECLSPFHCVKALKKTLIAKGYVELPWTEKWTLEINGRYYIEHQDGKSLIAFVVGEQSPCRNGFQLACAHTDSPALKIKLNPHSVDNKVHQILTQFHGSPIMRSWMDRPLLAAGSLYFIQRHHNKVVFGEESALPQVERVLVQSEEAVGVIPDVAIHLDREKNQKGEINPETMLNIAAAMEQGERNFVEDFFSSLLDGEKKNVDGCELYFAPAWPHTFAGLYNDFIVGPRHDDLAMVYAIHQGLLSLKQDAKQKTIVAGYFDSEESGSLSSSGAASSFMKNTLLSIAKNHPNTKRSYEALQSLGQSFLISADMAHGYHPAYASKFDSNHKVLLGDGLVIKENANERYATNGKTATIFRGLCEAAELNCQNYIHRQDLGCGSTIGPILAASLNCETVDIGTPMWGMHSSAETLAVKDLFDAYSLFKCYFNNDVV